MAHSSLEAVIEIFSSNLGIHRINVINNKGRVEGILSKTDVIRFFLSKLEVFKEAVGKTLLEVGLGSCPVVTISSSPSHCSTLCLPTNLCRQRVSP